MSKKIPRKATPVDERFNAFHLEITILNERMAWLLEKIDFDEPGLAMLRSCVDHIEFLLDSQDCRPGAR